MGGEAGLADGVCEGLGVEALWGWGAGHVEYAFLGDGAVEVVGAVVEGDLGEGEAEADPVGGDVGDVVEVDAGNGDGAEIVGGGGAGEVGEGGVLGFEGEGDEGGEAGGFVLELAEAAEVVDAVLWGFEVAVEHGAGAAASDEVPEAVDVEPFFCGFFAAADLVADGGVEDFCAAAGEGVEAGFFECVEGVGDGDAGDALG